MTIKEKIDQLRLLPKAEVESAREDLSRLEYIHDLWMQFGDIPMDPATECLEAPFVVPFQYGDMIHAAFPAGTHREDIWHWFEETFCISVAEDLMGV